MTTPTIHIEDVGSQVITGQHAMWLLLNLRFCPRDAYDLLADAGIEPDTTTTISVNRLRLEIAAWMIQTATTIF